MISTTSRRAVLALACVAMCVGPAAAASKTPWQLSRYRIQVLVAVDAAADLPAAFQADLCAALAARSDALLGGPWELIATAAPAELNDRLVAGLDAIGTDALPKPAAEVDKQMLVAIAADSKGYVVSAREFDVRSQAWGAVVRLAVSQPAKLRDAALQGVVKAFAPLALVHAVDKDQVRLRVRASAVPPRDPSVSLVKPGSVLRPVVRFSDGRTAPLPWTALVVSQANPEEAQARIVTGLKTQLFAYSGTAAEPLALGVTPGPVSLSLQSPRDAKIGRPVYDVVSADAKVPLAARADSEGNVKLPGDAVRIVEVRSGQQPVARVPLVTGGTASASLAVPADVRLLEAESHLAAAQDELADLVTLRQILLSRAEKALDSKKTSDAKDALAELQALKTRQKFVEELASRQKSVIAEDVAVQQRIDALFAELIKLAEEQLDPKPIDALAAEVKRAK
jgi:hypothetical protein